MFVMSVFYPLKKKKICLRDRERERAHMGAGGGVLGEGKQTPRWVLRVEGGARPHDPEIRTRAETKSGVLNQLSHPGGP